MDPLYSEVADKLDNLISDLHVNALIESVSSLRCPSLTDFLSKRVSVAAKLSRPATSLNVVKFMYLYGKKDARFFSLLNPNIPSLVMFCYQTAEDPENLTLYIESWKMNTQWRAIADKCLSAIALKGLAVTHSDDISKLSTLLKKSELPFLLDRVPKNMSDPKLLQDVLNCAELRLHAVIDALNIIEKIT